jgi:hypothetical protein
MRVRYIKTAAEIPMKCSACDWSGNNAQCKAIDPSKFVPGRITGMCPQCKGSAVQIEDCKYSFQEPVSR